MKNLLISLGVVATACGLTCGVAYFLSDNRAMDAAARDGDAMAWLRIEFRLSDAQFTMIKRMHDDYSIVCGKHCADIMEARERRAPAAEIAALEQVCVDAMTAHFREVAAQMPPGQGERYLGTVLPQVATYSHHGAPNVRATPSPGK